MIVSDFIVIVDSFEVKFIAERVVIATKNP